MKSIFSAPTSTVLALTLLSSVTLTGCLKTRAQLRQDGDSQDVPASPNSPGTPAQVTDVQPQGGYAIDEMKGEITRLNGRIEDLERGNQQKDAAAATGKQEDIKKLEARIVELENAQANMLDAIKKLQGAQAAAVDSSVDYFEKGSGQYQAGELEASIESFSAYLKNPKAPHVQEATYMRGEAYFQLKQYKKAIIDFSKFPEKYPRSKRNPAALLKIGQSFDAMGMKEDAKGFYQELTDKYPRSPEARKARSRAK